MSYVVRKYEALVIKERRFEIGRSIWITDCIVLGMLLLVITYPQIVTRESHEFGPIILGTSKPENVLLPSDSDYILTMQNVGQIVGTVFFWEGDTLVYEFELNRDWKGHMSLNNVIVFPSELVGSGNFTITLNATNIRMLVVINFYREIPFILQILVQHPWILIVLIPPLVVGAILHRKYSDKFYKKTW